MMEKKAVLVVSFGTSHTEVIESCICPVEKAIADALLGWDFYRAFTSRMITKKLAEKEGIFVNKPPEALEKLAADGYTEIIVQPTHILAGTEYHDLKAQTEAFGENSIRRFCCISDSRCFLKMKIMRRLPCASKSYAAYR